MFEEYAKQFDLVIDKDEYDRSNFEEKIAKREEEQLKQYQTQPNKLAQQKPIKKNTSNKNNLSQKNSNTSNLRKKQEKNITDNDLNKKIQNNFDNNLKLRNTHESLQKKHEELSKKLQNIENNLSKASKEKEDLAKYLFQIEKVVRNATSIPSNTTVMSFSLDKDNETESSTNNSLNEIDKKNYDIFYSQSLTINISGNSPNIVIEDNNGIKNIILSKSDLMKYLNKLYKENQGLKNFQNQVFDLSKAYDDTNNHLAECIASFEELCTVGKKKGIDEKNVDEKLNELKMQILNSLETKKNEYTMLLDKKEEDLNLIKEEFLENEKEVKEGNERLSEQKKIMELYDKIGELNAEIEKIEEENKKKEEESHEELLRK